MRAWAAGLSARFARCASLALLATPPTPARSPCWLTCARRLRGRWRFLALRGPAHVRVVAHVPRRTAARSHPLACPEGGRRHGHLPPQRPRHRAVARLVGGRVRRLPERRGAARRAHRGPQALRPRRARRRRRARAPRRRARLGPWAPVERGPRRMARRQRARREALRVRASPRAVPGRAARVRRGLLRRLHRPRPGVRLGHPRLGRRQPARPRARERAAAQGGRLRAPQGPEDHEGLPLPRRGRQRRPRGGQGLEGGEGRGHREGLQLQGRHQADHEPGGGGGPRQGRPQDQDARGRHRQDGRRKGVRRREGRPQGHPRRVGPHRKQAPRRARGAQR